MRKLIGLLLLVFYLNPLLAVENFDVSSLSVTVSGSNITINGIPTYDDSTPGDPTNGLYKFTLFLTTGEIITLSHDALTSSSITIPSTSGATSGLIEIVAVYDDKNDDPKRITFGFSPPSVVSDFVAVDNSTDSLLKKDQEPLEFYLPGNKFLNSYPVNPRKGDTALYRLTYSNSCNDKNLNGVVQFSASVGNIIEVFNPYSTETGIAVSGNSVGFNFTNLGYNNFRDCYILLELPPDLVEDEIVFTIESFDGVTSCKSTTITHPLSEKLDPHDPNKICSEVKSICPDSPPPSIEYYITFENIGKGYADSVLIWFDIPYYFQSFPISLINVKHAGGLHQNIEDNRVSWVINSDDESLRSSESEYQLLGAKQKGVTNFNLTKDTVFFNLILDKDKPLPPCGQIPIQAKIVFDTQPPFWTNTYVIQIECNECNQCDSKEYFSLSPLRTKKSELTFEGFPAEEMGEGELTYLWYPNFKINDPTLEKPTFSGVLDQVYYVTVSGTCFKKTYRIPITVGSEPSPPGIIEFLIPALIIIVVIGIVIFFRI